MVKGGRNGDGNGKGQREPRLSPSLYSPASPKMADSNGRPQSTDSGVLDLSKRRDSLDATRKTPSPAYHCFSEVAGTPPPSNHSSPQQCEVTDSNNPESSLLLNYSELVRARRLSPTKSLLHSSQRKPKELEDGTVPKDGQQQQQQQQYPMVVGRDGKLSRPFKAYPRDPLSLAAGFVASDTILDTNSAEKYNLFRKRMLEQIHAANGGQPTVSNPKMRRLANASSCKSSSSNAPSAAMSDASSESCDEKPPSVEHVGSNRALLQQHHRSMMAGSEMAQRVATTNQRLMTTPSCKDAAAAAAACDVIGSSDASGAESSATIAAAPSNGSSGNTSSTSVKDSAYYERRKKNNAAAKKSRDRRRIKEDEIAIRAAFLERENIELKFELAAARKQLALYGVTTSVAAS
uniref:BZIP domain-containing protein n=1 Tax=Anopheles merus TaxID=30066 RepID=A0A182UNX2_ANOME